MEDGKIDVPTLAKKVFVIALLLLWPILVLMLGLLGYLLLLIAWPLFCAIAIAIAFKNGGGMWLWVALFHVTIVLFFVVSGFWLIPI